MHLIIGTNDKVFIPNYLNRTLFERTDGNRFYKRKKSIFAWHEKNPTDVCAASDVFTGRNSSFQRWLCYDRNMWCGFSLAINSVPYYTDPSPPLTRMTSSSNFYVYESLARVKTTSLFSDDDGQSNGFFSPWKRGGQSSQTIISNKCLIASYDGASMYSSSVFSYLLLSMNTYSVSKIRISCSEAKWLHNYKVICIYVPCWCAGSDL